MSWWPTQYWGRSSDPEVPAPVETVISLGWSQWPGIILREAQRLGIVPSTVRDFKLLVIDSKGSVLVTLNYSRYSSASYAVPFQVWSQALKSEIGRNPRLYGASGHRPGSKLTISCLNYQGTQVFRLWDSNYTLPTLPMPIEESSTTQESTTEAPQVLEVSSEGSKEPPKPTAYPGLLDD